MIEMQTLQTIEEAASRQDWPALFACLASRYAAVRAKTAETFLKLKAGAKRGRAGLARDFGREPDAVTSPLFAEFSAAIGWQSSPAWPRFLASLEIGLEQWREGIGYDLEALGAMHPEEQSMIRQWLRTRLKNGSHTVDWRELEAADALGDTELLQSLTGHPEGDVRLRVQRYLGDDAEVEKELCRVLREASSHRPSPQERRVLHHDWHDAA